MIDCGGECKNKIWQKAVAVYTDGCAIGQMIANEDFYQTPQFSSSPICNQVRRESRAPSSTAITSRAEQLAVWDYYNQAQVRWRRGKVLPLSFSHTRMCLRTQPIVGCCGANVARLSFWAQRQGSRAKIRSMAPVEADRETPY